MAPEARINDRIRAAEVRLIGQNGEQVGIMPAEQALARARELDLDLVEVAPQAEPPVCRLMDYGKWKYEQDMRAREARKKQSQIVVKEMKYRIKISGNDFEVKTKQVEKFLGQGHKVKVTIMFKGREMVHPELGQRLLERVAGEVSEIATVEAAPKLDGRNMVMVLAPVRKPGGKVKDDGTQPAPETETVRN
ncbi:MAG: translation initiation factor IF-3 [Actinomycetota bacterium]